MRNPSWTKISVSLVALAALYTSQQSPAAADTCLAAPNSAAPNGQHWYYRSDRATQRKCWFLRETITKPAATATAPSAGADTSARPAAPVEAARPTKPAAPSRPPRDASAQPIGASSIDANSGDATPVSTAPAQAEMESAEPFEPTSEPIVAATPWPAPQPAPVGAQKSDATPSGIAPAVISNTTEVRAAVKPEAVAQDDPKPVTAAAPDSPSTNSVAQDLLIIGLAATLAGAVSVIIAMLRRRKPTTKAANFNALAAALAAAVSANVAALRRRKVAKAKPADFSPRFGSKSDRQGIGRLSLQRRETKSPQSAPIQTSLVPEQLTMARPFVAPRRQERINRDWRARAE